MLLPLAGAAEDADIGNAAEHKARTLQERTNLCAADGVVIDLSLIHI